MKLVYPDIHQIIEFEKGISISLVIENADLFREIICDIVSQQRGHEGKMVLSDEDRVLPLIKYAELILSPLSVDADRKSLISKLCTEMEKSALSEKNIDDTNCLLASIEKFLLERAEELDIDVECGKNTIGQIIKAFGISIPTETTGNMPDTLLSYMELVRKLESDRLFIFVNLKSYISTEIMQQFLDTVNGHDYNILMIDNKEYPLLKGEKRIIIDEDLCEIS